MTETQTQKPVNNIYIVPIKEISFMACLDEPPAVGHCETQTLSEGRNEEYAKYNLTQYPGFYKNWKNLTSEQKQRIQPFLLDNDREVEKILHCERRFKNRQEDYICGIPFEDSEPNPNGLNGEFGICCIMNGYDTPDFESCPYQKESISF